MILLIPDYMINLALSAIPNFYNPFKYVRVTFFSTNTISHVHLFPC